MKPWVTLAEDTAPDGRKLVLQQRDDEQVIRMGGQVLMSSRQHGSEEAMAAAALTSHVRPDSAVLVGGLGLGYSLRAVLDRVSPTARITVAELFPAVVRWNRGPLAPLAGAPLGDARVTVYEGDVRALVERSERAFDAILLDVDNGPSALTKSSNAQLYDRTGLSRLHRALRPQGRLVVWSAGPDAAFVRRLTEVGFTASDQTVPARDASAGARHVLFIAERSS